MSTPAEAVTYHRKKLRPGKIAGAAAVNLILIIFSIIIAMPFFWMITNSLKTKAEIWAKPPVLFPAVPQWQNFKDALGDGYLMMYTFNSLIYAVVGTIIVLINSPVPRDTIRVPRLSCPSSR